MYPDVVFYWSSPSPHSKLRTLVFVILTVGLLSGSTNAARHDALWNFPHHVLSPTGVERSEPQTRVREPGKPVKGELAYGESHAYRISLALGQFLRVIIEQRTADTAATVFGAGGQQVGHFDSRWHGPELVSMVARAFTFSRPL
jgi:hypothetical protein